MRKLALVSSRTQHVQFVCLQAVPTTVQAYTLKKLEIELSSTEKRGRIADVSVLGDDSGRDIVASIARERGVPLLDAGSAPPPTATFIIWDGTPEALTRSDAPKVDLPTRRIIQSYRVVCPWAFDAFISYRRKPHDTDVAKALQVYLDAQRLSLSSRGDIHRPLVVFRDETDLDSAQDLSAGLRTALDRSRKLIVLCSDETRESKWIRKEIEYFKKVRGAEHIIWVLVGVTQEPEDLLQKLIAQEDAPLAVDLRPRHAKEHYLHAWRRKRNGRESILAAIAEVQEARRTQWTRQRRRARTLWQGIAAMGMLGVALATQGLAVWWRARPLPVEITRSSGAYGLLHLDETDPAVIPQPRLEMAGYVIAVDATGHRAATAHRNRIVLWDARAAQKETEYTVGGAIVWNLAFDRTGRWLASSDVSTRRSPSWRRSAGTHVGRRRCSSWQRRFVWSPRLRCARRALEGISPRPRPVRIWRSCPPAA